MILFDKLLGENNPKTRKGEASGYLTFTLSLSPAKSGGGADVCAWRSAGCTALCVAWQGRARTFPHLREARRRRTRYWNERPEAFLEALDLAILRGIRIAAKRGLLPAFRLNCFSDVPWERYLDLESYPAEFYDYTKAPLSARRLPDNYSLCYSLSEKPGSLVQARRWLEAERTVAVVFPKGWQARRFLGAPVVDGDENDLRFLDQPGSVIGLRAKGTANKSNSLFIVRPGSKLARKGGLQC